MTVRRAWEVMGTWASLVAADDEQAEVAQVAAAQVLDEVDQRFSSYRTDSEVSRFNRGEVPQPSGSLREVLAACAWLAEESAGVFSARHSGSGGSFDVAGYVKGWAVDLAATELDRLGIEHYAIGVGGDWRLRGGHPQGRPWRWSVLDPQDRSKPRALLDIRDGAVATSGNYERGRHLYADDEVAAEVESFTVVGPALRWADAFATTGYLMGLQGLEWVAGFEGYTGAVIAPGGAMIADDAFPLTIGSEFPAVAAPYC